MKNNSKKWQPAVVLLYVLLFTTATGAFNSMACQLNKNTGECTKEAAMPAIKKVSMPAVNPLQILTSKFM